MLLSLTFSRGWLREWKKKLSRHVVVVGLIDLTLSNAKKKEKTNLFDGHFLGVTLEACSSACAGKRKLPPWWHNDQVAGGGDVKTTD